METGKTIGFVFIEGFADWEYGLLAASAVEWFGDRVVSLSPGGAAVTSIAGFRMMPERGIDPAQNGDLDAIAFVGSDGWATDAAPDISALAASVRARGGAVGAICGATLGLARAGLFGDVKHTSNGRDWIGHHLPDYPGHANYMDVPHAVSDAGIVSAPGSAPGTFAVAFLQALHPDKLTELAQMRTLFAGEYADAS